MVTSLKSTETDNVPLEKQFALSLCWFVPVGWVNLKGPKQRRHLHTNLSPCLNNAQSIPPLWNVL